MKEETKKELSSLSWKIYDEGIDYTLMHYSDWKELKEECPELYRYIREYQTLTQKIERMVKILCAKNDIK